MKYSPHSCGLIRYPGEPLTTGCAGSFVRGEVSRNKRSRRWRAAPIEVSVIYSVSINPFQDLLPYQRICRKCCQHFPHTVQKVLAVSALEYKKCTSTRPLSAHSGQLSGMLYADWTTLSRFRGVRGFSFPGGAWALTRSSFSFIS